jgi:hypothetical protein
MNTNIRAPQVKHLTLFLAVLLRYLTDFVLPSDFGESHRFHV